MSLKLIKSSFTVLRLDKELLIYPLISTVVILLLWGLITYLSYVTGLVDHLMDSADQDGTIDNPLLYITVLIFYICTHFLITFFNTALISSALTRFEGGNPTLSDGFNMAISRLKYIFTWSVLSGTVSLLLKILEKRSNRIQGIVMSTLGLTWGVCSYLVIPFIIKEELYPFSALKKSSQLIKQTWGTALVTEIGLGFFGFILFALGFGILWIFSGAGIPVVYAIPVMITYWIILWLISFTLNSIVVAGVYMYGKSGKMTTGFNEEQLKEAFHQK